MKKIMIILTLTLCTSFVHAGGERGNGGDAVVCYQDSTKKTVTSIQLFDHWEMSQRYPELGRINFPENAPIETLIDQVTDRLKDFEDERAHRYREEAKRIANNIEHYLVDTLDEVNDENSPLKPTAPCYLEQFAVQFKKPAAGERRFLVHRGWYHHPLTTNLSRAGLILHEVIYRDAMVSFGHQNSEGARLLNFLYVSSSFSTLTQADLIRIWKMAGFEYATKKPTWIAELGTHAYLYKIKDNQYGLLRPLKIQRADLYAELYRGTQFNMKDGRLLSLSSPEESTHTGWYRSWLEIPVNGTEALRIGWDTHHLANDFNGYLEFSTKGNRQFRTFSKFNIYVANSGAQRCRVEGILSPNSRVVGCRLVPLDGETLPRSFDVPSTGHRLTFFEHYIRDSFLMTDEAGNLRNFKLDDSNVYAGATPILLDGKPLSILFKEIRLDRFGKMTHAKVGANSQFPYNGGNMYLENEHYQDWLQVANWKVFLPKAPLAFDLSRQSPLVLYRGTEGLGKYCFNKGYRPWSPRPGEEANKPYSKRVEVVGTQEFLDPVLNRNISITDDSVDVYASSTTCEAARIWVPL